MTDENRAASESKNRIIQLRKNAQGDIIFEINPQSLSATTIIKALFSLLLKVFLPVFAFFDFLATKRKLVISSVGLGIGLGLSVLVTQRPDTLQAFPTLATQNITDIYASRVIISSIDLSTAVTKGNLQDLFDTVSLQGLVHDERSAALGGRHPVVIAEVGFSNILQNLDSVQIGDEIRVVGTNEAVYSYRVTELRDMNSEYLPNVIGVNQDALILYKSKNILRTQLYMVIAQSSI